jgi:hypothetical protein
MSHLIQDTQIRDGYNFPKERPCWSPPQKGDYTLDSKNSTQVSKNAISRLQKKPKANSLQKPMKHWIACLFTSRHSGRKVSTPNDILFNTEHAVEDLKRQLSEWDIGGSEPTTQDVFECRPGDLWSCRFNSGLFSVEWGKSLQILRKSGLKVTVVRPKGQEWDVFKTAIYQVPKLIEGVILAYKLLYILASLRSSNWSQQAQTRLILALIC